MERRLLLLDLVPVLSLNLLLVVLVLARFVQPLVGLGAARVLGKQL